MSEYGIQLTHRNILTHWRLFDVYRIENFTEHSCRNSFAEMPLKEQSNHVISRKTAGMAPSGLFSQLKNKL